MNSTVTLIVMMAILIAIGYFVRGFIVAKSETLTLEIDKDYLKLLDWSEWVFIAMAIITGKAVVLFFCIIGMIAEGQLNRIRAEEQAQAESTPDFPVDRPEKE